MTQDAQRTSRQEDAAAAPKKIRPATPLPWTRMPEVVAAFIQCEQDEHYACHAANTYPGLIRVITKLRELIAASLDDLETDELRETHRGVEIEVSRLLRELGEL